MPNPSCTKCTSPLPVCREFLGTLSLSLILFAVAALLLFCPPAYASTTLSAQTSNNTSGLRGCRFAIVLPSKMGRLE
jgi:hypothetical protein